jgi:hypothetical protein
MATFSKIISRSHPEVLLEYNAICSPKQLPIKDEPHGPSSDDRSARKIRSPALDYPFMNHFSMVLQWKALPMPALLTLTS